MKKFLFHIFIYSILIFVLLYNPISARILTFAFAKIHNLDPEYFYKQIKSESSFNPFAKSPQNACGLGQLRPSTAKYIYPQFRNWMLWFPPLNLHIAAKYDLYLLKKYNNNWSIGLAAYNWGETNVDKHINDLEIQQKLDYSHLFSRIPETHSYLQRVLKAKN